MNGDPPQELSSTELSASLRQELTEADALPEIVVLYDPPAEVLEAYGLEERLGVIAVVSGSAEERARALEAGALEVIDPALPDEEARTRLQMAVARFRSRLLLERGRERLDRQAESVERDLRLAARLQRSLLPRVLPQLPGLSFSTAYLPREFVSGDSYEVRQLGPRLVAVYTLDAVGHGVRAAFLTVLLRSVFRPLADDGTPRPPHEVIGELNRFLLEASLEESPTVAFCYAVIDVEQGRARLANAGHPLPVRLRSGGSSEHLGSSGLLLGVDPEPYATVEVDLAAGDRLFFFTDGANPGYGDGFAKQLRVHADLDLEDQVGGALGAVIRLDEEGRPEDDVTVVAMQFGGQTTAGG